MDEDELTCPHCGKSMDGYELYIENGGPSNEGDMACLYCHEDVADDDWIRN